MRIRLSQRSTATAPPATPSQAAAPATPSRAAAPPRSSKVRAMALAVSSLLIIAVTGLLASPAAAASTLDASGRLSPTVEPAADVIVDEELPPPDQGDENETTTIEISTIPPLVGVVVQVDDQTSTTDDDGIARFRTDRRANLQQRITVVTADIDRDAEGYRADYARLYRIDSRNYALAFDLHLPLTFSFSGSNGENIDAETIDALNLKNSLGGVVPDVPLDRPIWVHAQRVVSTQRGPELRDIEWSIESVLVSETNVVNRAQVRFLPSEGSHIAVPLLFFSATFRIADMFFNTPAGSSIELTYPDGMVLTHPLDDDGVLTIDSLPRGEYHAVVIGSGPKISRPVALSRNQDLELELLSWLDIALVVLVVAMFISLPVVAGRRLLHQRAAPTSTRRPAPTPQRRPPLAPVPQPVREPGPAPTPSPVRIPAPDPSPIWPPPAAAEGPTAPAFGRILLEAGEAEEDAAARPARRRPNPLPLEADPAERRPAVAEANPFQDTTILDLTAFDAPTGPPNAETPGHPVGDRR